MAREADFALKQYQYDKFTVQSTLLSVSDHEVTMIIEEKGEADRERRFTIWQSPPAQGVASFWETGEVGWPSVYFDSEGSAGETTGEEQKTALFRALAEGISVPAAFFAQDGSCLYSQIEDLDMTFLEGLSADAHAYRFQDTGRGSSVLVGSMVECGGLGLSGSVLGGDEAGADGAAQQDGDGRKDGEAKSPEVDSQRIYFVTQWDISKTLQQQETLQRYFVHCYMTAMTIGMALLGLLSAFLTGPLKRMSRAARRMAEGDYGARLVMSGRDEIGEVAESFNQMAGAVEEKVEALSNAAREKEDFVANFAHELKTPLTSIIGYADMIYQKELPRAEICKASWHIWNEGMRLEALSFKLMELTVLGRQDFPLVELPADELLRDVTEGLAPLFTDRQVDFHLDAQSAYVMADYDLLKTLLLNLVDNSVKAGAKKIDLTGRKRDEKYDVNVTDNGCGMEAEALSRITEAFYMVDKARSRKQHGAGLGLALGDRIARIHGSGLAFESEKGKGTRVSFSLRCAEGGEEDGED